MKYNFDVRVCPQCKQKMERIEQINKIAAPGGIVAMILAFLALMGLTSLGLDAMINNFIWVALLFIAGLVAFLLPLINRIRIGTYNGQYFKFVNPAFQKQFAKLNPHLVQQKAKSAP